MRHEYSQSTLNKRSKRCSSLLKIDEIIDIGIEACDSKDTFVVRSVINTLKEVFSSQFNEFASGYYRLCDYCLRLVEGEKFKKARAIFLELHQSWNISSINDLIKYDPGTLGSSRI